MRPAIIVLFATACTGATEAPNAIDIGETPDESLLRSAAEGAAWGDNVTVTVTDTDIVVSSDGLPSHGYLDAYATFGGGSVATVAPNPVTVTVPLVPEQADAVTQTSLGAIGIAVSGAVFFNPYEGDGTTVALDDNFEIDGNPFIDECNGHPVPNSGLYHYHGIPLCVTSTLDSPGEHSRLVGYLLDGHAMYGPQGEGGLEPEDLDACLGHFGPTPEIPAGVYHYHTSHEAPYISPCYAGAVDAVMGGGMPPPP